MIDIHNHILFNVDDGAKNIEESVKMAMELEKAGVTSVCATSHFKKKICEIEKDTYNKQIEKLNFNLQKNNINLKILNGNEVYFYEDLISDMKQGKINTLNNGKYLLVELPMNFPVLYFENSMIELQNQGIIPIIAHPERYSYVQKNPYMLMQLIDIGILFQLNFGSLIGKYGKVAEKTANILLKHNMVHFVASDAHKSDNLYEEIKKRRENNRKIAK